MNLQTDDLIRAADLVRKAGDWETAAGLYEQILRSESRCVAAAIGLGISFQCLKRPTMAVPYLTRVVALGCDDPEVFRSLGLCYQAIGSFELALAAFRRESELDHTSATAFVRLGNALMQTGDIPASEEALRQAIKIDPGLASAHDALASLEFKLGNTTEGVFHSNRAAELAPSDPMYLARLLNGTKITKSDLHLVDRLKLARKGSGSAKPLSAEDKAYIEFALGKALEDLEDFEESANCYLKANAIALEHRVRLDQPFQPDSHRREIDFVIEGFPSAESFEESKSGSASNQPIFIVGMMRSGTTLVEQILSSHPSIGGAGEVSFWIEAGPMLHWTLTRKAPDMGKVRSAASQYLGVLAAKCAGKSRVIDKLPQNYMNLGVIHATFPNAKIIHCRRNSTDVCLSLFTTPFGRPPAFAYSAKNIASAYQQYRRVMNHWASVLPSDAFLEVDYEELVTDREAVTRKMVEFLGEEWRDSCLFPERNARIVETPSHWQVRQPVYSSSIGRWKRFAPYLGELVRQWTFE